MEATAVVLDHTNPIHNLQDDVVRLEQKGKMVRILRKLDVPHKPSLSKVVCHYTLEDRWLYDPQYVTAVECNEWVFLTKKEALAMLDKGLL